MSNNVLSSAYVEISQALENAKDQHDNGSISDQEYSDFLLKVEEEVNKYTSFND
jgi:hypothetical protein